jgi:Uma2 family endonuclease
MARSSSAASLPQRHFTVEQWHQMIESEIVGPDERLELLEGVIVTMPPHGPQHSFAIGELSYLIPPLLPRGYRVRVQLPLCLSEISEPEPDLAIVRAEDVRSPASHPHRALVVIEVANSSQRTDRSVKQRLYAQAGIPEFWLVLVRSHSVEVLTKPSPKTGRYLGQRVFRSGQMLRSPTLPEIAFPVVALFG